MLAFIIVLSVLIFVHEFGHFLTARGLGVKIERFSLGFGPVIFSFKKNETKYCLSLIPIGGYVKMAGETPEEGFEGQPWEFLSLPVSRRALIVLAGPVLNYLVAFLVFWMVFVWGHPTLSTRVGELMKDYPAEKAGILEGDRILSVEGKPVNTWEELTELIHNTEQSSLNIKLERGTKIMVLSVSPRREQITNIFGQTQEISLIGIKPSEEIIQIRYPFFQAFSLAGEKLWSLTLLTYRVLGRLLVGSLSLKDTVSGPIGIFYITRLAAKLGLVALLNFLGVLSASLAIFNLLPIPVLDGGHIFFLLIEKIRGRALSIKLQERITQIGMAFLIVLMLFVFYSDLIRFHVVEKIIEFWKK